MQSKRWDDTEIEYLKNNYNQNTNKGIGEYLGRTEKSIKKKMSQLGLKKELSVEWSSDEISFLIDNYKKLTNKQIGEVIGRTKTSVDVKASKLGLIKSKYVYDKYFFKEIDSEEKAYWLGFIYADGCVVYDSKSNGGEVCIKLKWSDSNHLKNFNKHINGNVQVQRIIETLNGKEYPQCSIRLYSSEMAKDLIDKGAYVNKTKIIDFGKTKVDESLMNHFIRGYFDGDGCVCKDSLKKRTIRADFTSGSYNFLKELRTFLATKGINSYICLDHANTYRLYIKGLNNYDNFYNYLYNNSTIWLDRKKERKESIYQEYEIAQRLLR